MAICVSSSRRYSFSRAAARVYSPSRWPVSPWTNRWLLAEVTALPLLAVPMAVSLPAAAYVRAVLPTLLRRRPLAGSL
jgi:hypothetical protein